MEHKYLIVIDMQNDFVTGALGTAEARTIVPRVVRKAKGFQGAVILTQDTHGNDYLTTQEGRILPIPHCIRGTEGWRLVPELDRLKKELGLTVYEKSTFGSIRLAKALYEKNKKRRIDFIELVGLCTDICVVSNAILFKAFLPETHIVVDASCCAGVTPETHAAALTTLRNCQVEIKDV